MTLDIDRMLNQDAENWRTNLPPDDGPGAMLRGARQPRGPGHRVLAVAGSVAAVVVLGVVVSLAWSPSTHSTSPATQSFSGPCQDDFVAAPSPFIPSTTIAFRNLNVILSYRGSGPCRVSAYGPYFEMRDANGRLLGVGSHSTLEAVTPDHLVVRRGDLLELAMRWTPQCSVPARVATVILHLDGRVNRSGVGVEVSVPRSYTPACDRHVIEPFSGFVERPRLITGMTTSQQALALRIAHEEAINSMPGRTDSHGMWPPNVDSVSVLVTSATSGAQYVGGSAAATGKVLVIRLTGRFSLVTSGPSGSGNATGNELTVLVPLGAEQVTDAGVETHHPPGELPNSTILFHR